MRSLWSGVSGLNAHQIAMDVEANNIANVNTVGFKYSRTNFQNLLSQTVKSATAPQGNLGGKNSLQIGLGTSVSAVETMYKQGSIQNTDKNTDMAINGDGFFVVSGDGGKTYKYTRAGDFTFDANGNFVDPNGYVVQGWLADPDTHTIDTASGVKPISIPPGLTTPAKETSKIQIKANLNSGDTISEMGGTRSTVEPDADINGLFDAKGTEISLTPGIDKVSMDITDLDGNKKTVTFVYGESQNDHDNTFKTLKDLIDEINYQVTHDLNGAPINTDERYSDYSVFLNGNGQIVDQTNRIDNISSPTNTVLNDILSELNVGNYSGNFKSIQNGFIGADDVGELFNSNGDAFNLEKGQGLSVNIDGLYETRKFIYTPDPLTANAHSCTTTTGNYVGAATKADSTEGLHWLYADADGKISAGLSISRDSNFNIVSHNTLEFTVTDSTGTRSKTYSPLLYGEDFNTIDQLCCELNSKFAQDSFNITISFDPTTGQFKETGTANITSAHAYDDSTGKAPTGATAQFDSIISKLGSGSASDPLYKKDTYYFHDIQDLTYLWQMAIGDSNDPTGNQYAVNKSKATVTVNSDGKLSIENTSGSMFNISISGYPSEQDNKLFTEAFSSLNGSLASGGVGMTQAMNAAIHTTSIDVFDSLGSKHTLTLHFRKTHTSTGPSDPTKWDWYAEVPAPAELMYPASGNITFNPDGSVNSFNPPSLILNANNGSQPGQAIQLDFGEIGGFDGITSFEAPSSTSGQTQDGYPGGDLQSLVVDQTGTIIGVFSNGRSYSLAQVALAKFVNNEGLMSDGGTLFNSSPNSGEPIIGTAGTGGRGSIQPSSLEMSNVDLSRSLTQLIIIQRGFQANSKTITTSDQMLNTLLQLKQ